MEAPDWISVQDAQDAIKAFIKKTMEEVSTKNKDVKSV